jgi:hypothetical protein
MQMASMSQALATLPEVLAGAPSDDQEGFCA